MHVKHRVVPALFQHLVEVEIQRCVVLAGQHVESRRPCPHLIDHIAQGHKGPCPFGHLERLAVFIKFHQLRQFDVQRHSAPRQCGHRRLHPFDIAAVIRPKHVNQRIIAALHLVVVIGDVGREIGPPTIRLHDRPVHVIAMFGRFEQCLFARFPILGNLAFGRLQRAFIDQALGFQVRNRRFDQAGAIERFLRVEQIHLDPECRQIGADQIHHRFCCEITDFGQPDVFVLVDIGGAHLVLERDAHIDEVVAGIGSVRKHDLLAMRLKITQVNRAGEHVDLCATIVDVVFARHVKASEIQQRGQRVAKHSPARVPDMQRPGGIGRYVFDIHLFARPHRGPAKIRASRQHGRNHTLPQRRGKPQVQEPRPCHFGAGDARICRQARGQCVRDIARFQARRLGQHHRGVGRHIPV